MKIKRLLSVFFLTFSLILFNCGGDDDEGGAENSITSISISSDISSQEINNAFTFTAIANTGVNVTATSTFKVNGSAITGNIFTPTTAGSYNVVATYNTFTSNELSITVSPAPMVFIKNVLIEDYTGAWCGYCPRVTYGIEQVKTQTTRVVPVAIHRGNSSGSNYDPFNFDAVTLENMIGLTGYPTAMLNRTTKWNYPEPNNVAQVVGLTGDNAELGLAISSTLTGTDISIDVNVKFGSDYSNQTLKLVVYLLEDDLILDQVNYTSYYGGTNPIVDFEHDYVLRASLTNLLGDAIPSSDTEQGGEYTKNFSLSVPSNISNSSKVSVVAFIVNSSNVAINSRKSQLGDTQTYEEN